MALEILRGQSDIDQQKADAFLFEDWGTLDTRSNRTSIADNDFAFVQNFIPIGKGNLRTTYAENASNLYTASGKLIIYHYAYNLGKTTYNALFLDDGSAVQVRESDGAVTTIAGAGTFFSGGSSIPGCSQWQSIYLLIASDVTTNGYFIWNGSILFGSGGISPDVTLIDDGSGYTSVPTVTAYGGSGSGATFLATVANGVVTQLALTNPGSGYTLNNQVVVGFSGGGSDSGAVAHATVTSASGGVSAALVKFGGTGYTSASVGTFSGGGGSGAEAVITGATNGVITAITITQPGSGYTSEPTLTFSVGTGATFQVVITNGQVTAITLDTGGSGYTGDPTILIVGDGVGATATATISGGAVSAIAIDNPGTGYSYAQVQISGGNRAAAALVNLMPFGVSGNTLDTYQARVWIANGTTTQVTAAESVANFAASAGGLAYPATDSFLRNRITRLIAAIGYIYQISDSACNVISNVQTTGNPPTTTISNANVDPQIGTPWRDSVALFGRAIVFANSTGVYALYSGAAEKVSDQLDGLFANASFNTGASGVTPSASVATFYSIRCYVLNFTTINPYTDALETLMVAWNGQRWFIVTQLKTPSFIAPQEIDSVVSSWGTDGTRLFHMFDTPSAQLMKVFQTKLRPDPTYIVEKQVNKLWTVANNNQGDVASISFSVDNQSQSGQNLKTLTYSNALTFIGAGGLPIQFIGAGGQPLNFISGGLAIRPYNPAMGGNYIGITGTTNAPDITMISITGEYSVVRVTA